MIRTMKKTTVIRIPLMTLTLENLGYFKASKNHLIREVKKHHTYSAAWESVLPLLCFRLREELKDHISTYMEGRGR